MRHPEFTSKVKQENKIDRRMYVLAIPLLSASPDLCRSLLADKLKRFVALNPSQT